MSINRVNITGNLTRDPELRATQSGSQVLSFGVAVNDRRRNPQTGEWEDYPNYVDCTMFGTRAEPWADTSPREARSRSRASCATALGSETDSAAASSRSSSMISSS